MATASGEMAAFAFVLLNADGAAHLTTIGVAPEHRRRGLAARLLSHLEEVLRIKGVSTIVLELRVSNLAAKSLYTEAGYSLVNRLTKYYSDGEDCFLMVKSLV
jgi:ribosomal protein S18 acetylase RimI-like enzyme